MLIVGKSISKIDRLKKQLSESFAMKDMGVAKQILGRVHWNVVKWILRGSCGLKCVALFTTETKFISITKACKELLWVKKFLQELGFVQHKNLLFYDSQGAIHLGKNSTFHSRSKHIEVRYHWIRDALDAKLLELAKVHTDDNGANMMTKDDDCLPPDLVKMGLDILGQPILGQDAGFIELHPVLVIATQLGVPLLEWWFN
ncbi:hypothetical protein CR513_48913, partial [Mucuna pruriens]